MTQSDDRKEWLKDSEEFFKMAKSYNTAIITVGYATFFACLVFLSKQNLGPLVLIAMLLLVASASIFVANEIVTHIRIARMASKMGEEGNRNFRRWKNYFVPSLVLGVAAVGILVFLLLNELLEGLL